MEIVIFGLETFGVDELFPGIFNNFVTTSHFAEVTNISSSILGKYRAICTGVDNITAPTACTKFQLNLGIHKQIGNRISPYGTPDTTAIRQGLEGILGEATKTAKAAELAESTKVTAELTNEKTGEIAATYMGYHSTIIASIIAIVIIVLIMVIIYLILRYRRKKKMKKKLQYIKLLEE
ncbi:hypothetical protein PFMC_00635 [Plasmodium falciparum CAMP/Malaysia]|uniref:Rifin n=1 Tax=Plasmodium falciparum (isolate Camp / Malaysia) TaxID=5835 RepID=A0A024XE62_PLAFC|nr:hypothetical protein PFMC_00635 [Plasmodium falciparum CAMP/Malaysia]